MLFILLWLAAFIVAILFSIVYENGIIAFLLMLGCASLFFISESVQAEFNIMNFVSENYTELLIGSVIYIALGAAWMVARWILYVVNEKELYTSLKEKFLTGDTNIFAGWAGWVVDDAFKTKNRTEEGFKEYCQRYNIRCSAPKVSNHKNDLFRWFAWWPFSIVDTILRDISRKLFNIIFNYFKSFMQKISDKIFEN